MSSKDASSNWLLRLMRWYIAASLAIGICVGTGLINNWGQWYSPSLPYRQQTEALLKGRIALTTSPSELERDWVWYQDRAQQVWGLGVPGWRLLFEAPVRLLGQPAFPDRIAFGIALTLLSFVVLRVFGHRNDGIDQRKARQFTFIAVLFTVLFPPFLTLCRVRFNVYEEAVAYGYICSVGLFAGTLAFVRSPRLSLYLAICLGAGLLGFVRPTAGAYGLATVAITWFVTCRAKWSFWKSALGPGLFGFGILLLLLSNQVRFGSFLEFGHRLNLSATNAEFVFQFHNSFGREPLGSAMRELFGGLFFVRDLNGFDVFRNGVVPWQSETIRYRSFYHTTFDWTFLVMIFLCWGFFLFRMLRGRRGDERWSENPLLVVAAVWSVLAIVPLALLYLRFPWLCSRYLFDFAPAFSAALLGCAGELWLRGQSERKSFQVFLLGAVTVWWGFEVISARTATKGEAISRTEVLGMLHRIVAPARALPKDYFVGQDLPELYGIPYNGEGWLPSGEVRCVVTLFVSDLDKLVLELAPETSDGAGEPDYSILQARVGSEFLKIESIKAIPTGKEVTFAPPATPNYRTGIQVVYVAFATAANYQRERPPFRLLRASWRS